MIYYVIKHVRFKLGTYLWCYQWFYFYGFMQYWWSMFFAPNPARAFFNVSKDYNSILYHVCSLIQTIKCKDVNVLDISFNMIQIIHELIMLVILICLFDTLDSFLEIWIAKIRGNKNSLENFESRLLAQLFKDYVNNNIG